MAVRPATTHNNRLYTWNYLFSRDLNLLWPELMWIFNEHLILLVISNKSLNFEVYITQMLLGKI